MQEEDHEPVCHGTVGLYEGAEEILVATDSHRFTLVRKFDCVDTGFGGRSFYLYIILGMKLI